MKWPLLCFSGGGNMEYVGTMSPIQKESEDWRAEHAALLFQYIT